jgi:PIN domain nuclease of toxin-antitoxin system
VILIDTHVLIWLVNGNPRLGLEARGLIDRGAATQSIHVSAITAWEIALLALKGRLELADDPAVWIARAMTNIGTVPSPIDGDIAVAAASLITFHADPADRFLVATARHHGWLLLTADRAILAYGEAGHLQVIDAAQ